MDSAIIVKELYKKYKLYNNGKERLLDIIRKNKLGKDFYALSNINFVAEQGEVIGFIGINGSGKSTLSNIIAGIVPETSGQVIINGQVALIAVAAGLKNDLTGRDNIELKLLMLGFNRKQIKELEEKIIEFSELDQFIDQPVKSYSSGMRSRLGFSISVNVDPDILIIDEALSVGDKAFAEKSLQKMKEFKARGKTMIFVSHSIGQMKQFCDKILWLEFGMVKEYGDVKEVIPRYEAFLRKWQLMKKEEREAYKDAMQSGQKLEERGITKSKEVNLDAYVQSNFTDKYVENPVSMIGHFKAMESFIYKSLDNTEQAEISAAFKHKVYYIRKQSSDGEDTFYLLSEKPSGVDGVIGWVNSHFLSIHRHVIVDYDEKKKVLNGKGKAFDKPWGGRKNCIIEDLDSFRDQETVIIQTDFVGNNVWYKIKMNEKIVWIHSSSVY